MDNMEALGVIVNTFIVLIGWTVNAAVLLAYRKLRENEGDEDKPITCLGRAILIPSLIVPYGMAFLIVVGLVLALGRYLWGIARKGMV